MSQSESHPVRNGIIATVVGGVILWILGLVWPPAKSALLWGINALFAVWHALIASYSIPGWVLVILVVICMIAIVGAAIYAARNSSLKPSYLSYIKDSIHGVTWHWTWNSNQIHRLWAACPACQGQIIYGEDPDAHYVANPRVKLYCENCSSVVAHVPGTDRSYVLGSIEREILRRIRVRESQD